jgi:alkanesulfonate monooxygenase SsuD/methylene tetrahydromethanopterin reductase-like flavin-dependent oxidoreductase (luciferase family)
MKIGVFDHLDYGGAATPGEFYEARLKLGELYEQVGIYAYHLAEHHATPLGMAPSPNVFLSALAQRTSRLRFGPVVYCLPLYHPVRLLEEICMLDQMSGGRLEMGIGKGISPIEHGYYGLDYDQAPALYREALELITEGMKGGVLNFKGEYFQVEDMPINCMSVQMPHPPMWCGVVNPASALWPAENNVNVVTNLPVGAANEVAEAFFGKWRETHADGDPEPLMGMTRYMVIAETDEAALKTARRAYPIWRKSFFTLWDRYGKGPIGVNYAETFDGMVETGQGIAGTPERVRDEIQRQYEEAGINYFLCRFAFGDQTPDELRRTVELFGEKVIGEL